MPSRFLIPKSARPHLPPPRSQSPVYHQQPPASPVHLSAGALLQPGASAAVPVASLLNPMGQDMEILEVKFEIQGEPGGINFSASLGGTVSCEFMLGSHKITNGSIPVWAFGRAENLDGESMSGLSDQANGVIYYGYSWRLPRPLYIPAGAVLAPTLVNSGLFPNPAFVRIGYSARTVFTQPKRVCVPWVAKYTSKVFNPIDSADNDQSTPFDLMNPHSEPVFLQRFCGRTLIRQIDDNATEDQPASFGGQYLTMRMVDSYGRPIVRNYTPFRSVFNAATRSWELDNGAQLDPGGFYTVNLKKAASTSTGNYALASGQAFVSMVGWRELGGL